MYMATRASVKFIATVLLAVALFVVFSMYLPSAFDVLDSVSGWLVERTDLLSFMGDDASDTFGKNMTTNTMMGIVVAGIGRVLVETVALIFGGVISGR